MVVEWGKKIGNSGSLNNPSVLQWKVVTSPTPKSPSHKRPGNDNSRLPDMRGMLLNDAFSWPWRKSGLGGVCGVGWCKWSRWARLGCCLIYCHNSRRPISTRPSIDASSLKRRVSCSPLTQFLSSSSWLERLIDLYNERPGSLYQKTLLQPFSLFKSRWCVKQVDTPFSWPVIILSIYITQLIQKTLMPYQECLFDRNVMTGKLDHHWNLHKMTITN